MTSSDYEVTSVAALSSSSHPHVMMLTSGNNTSSSPEQLGGVGRGGGMVVEGTESGVGTAGRWCQDQGVYSYSDNEKQLMEEMRRMKKEHQDTLRTYEGRINKLMAKMHELRSIAEMLENSSTKTSPYALLPAKATLLNIIASGTGEKKSTGTGEGDVPPPLPPRPGRGGRVYPNKPIVHTRTRMKALPWSRIILGESGEEDKQRTVWHGMQDVTVDTEDLERLYSVPPEPSTDDVTLLDDIYAIRNRPRHQLMAMFDGERSQRILTEMKNLRCRLHDVIGAVNSLDCRQLHQDSFAELLELLNSPRDVDKILHHAKRKGGGQLDTAEYLIFEMSKLDHFRERLEFLRFKNKLQINLFEIDQQLRELNTACDELINNVPLKSVLETILSLGNYLNGGTERGQADGFGLDVLNKLKDIVDRTHRGNLLELVMRTYCVHFEADLDLGCPTRFRLPEPSNMRHAAQVSFEEIQKALRDLREELSQVRERLEVLSRRESSNLAIALRVSSENFLTSAVEVLGEERRFLEDTKAHFWKTTSYFHYSRQCSPQEFFQTLATFLHDCKYYWKLAHRNLARQKFERDFATKCQLSCSSLPGFSQLKDSMMRTVVTLQKDQDMRLSKAQQLQHINNWIESLGKYDHDLQPESAQEATYGNMAVDLALSSSSSGGQRNRKQSRHREQRSEGGGQQKGQGRSPSPKPITSTPPNVHKPQPISHVSPTPGSSAYSSTSFTHANANAGAEVAHSATYAPSNHHYHQPVMTDSDAQDEVYEPLNRVVTTNSGQMEQSARDGADGGKRHAQDGGQRKNANFSLKSWLKRDQRPRNSADDLTSPHAPSHAPPSQSPQQQQQQQQQASSAKSPTTPFNKLRNTVVHKLAGSGGSKKSGGDVSKNNAPTVPPKPPRSALDADPVPTHHILFPSTPQQSQSQSQSQDATDSRPGPEMDDADTRDYQNFYYQLQALRDKRYSSGNNSAPSTLSSVTSREFAPHKYETVARAEDCRAREMDQSRYGSQDRNLYPAQDAGQTLSPPNGSESPQREGRGRNRAPIALNLGSNMSISDVYGRQEEEGRQQALVAPHSQHGPGQGSAGDTGRELGPHVPPQPSIVDSKRVKAQPVPIYKAKLIPNYENQTKLEPGIRGQAEPVQHSPVSHFPQSSNSSEVYRQELQRKSEMYVNNYPALSPLSPTSPGQGPLLNNPSLGQTPPNQAFNAHNQNMSQTPPNQAYNQNMSQTPPNQAYNQNMSQTPPNQAYNQNMSQTPPNQAFNTHNQNMSQTPPKQVFSSYNQNMSQPSPSQTVNPQPHQAPTPRAPSDSHQPSGQDLCPPGVGQVVTSQHFSPGGQHITPQTTPKGSAHSLTVPDNGLSPGNANSPHYGGHATTSSPHYDGVSGSSPNYGPVSSSSPNYGPVSGSGSQHYGPVTPDSPNYDDFQTPARRSASAQNILERSVFGPDGTRQSHHSEPGGSSHSYLATITRREEGRGRGGSGGRDTARDPNPDVDAAPAKVSTLITRWEKKHGAEDGGLGGPLMDGEDKPPSMTSTPVTRRKHSPGSREGRGEAVIGTPQSHAQPLLRRQPLTSARDVNMSGGVGQFVSGSRGHRSQSQPRERVPRDLDPHHGPSPRRADHAREQPHSQVPSTSVQPSVHHHHHHHRHHQERHHYPPPPPPQQQQQLSPHPSHPSTNTYPPRSSHPSGRSPGDVPCTLDRGDNYSQQLRKAGEKEAAKGTRPVPLPRQHIPSTATMAVVKPTVMHQGPLSYMDI